MCGIRNTIRNRSKDTYIPNLHFFAIANPSEVIIEKVIFHEQRSIHLDFEIA